MHMHTLRHAVLSDDHGAVATEHAILITLVAGVLVAVVFAIGASIAVFFDSAAGIF